MAQIITNYAAKKLLGSQLEKYKHKAVGGDDDPYFTTLPDKRGKPRKVKKQIPSYIPDHDASVLSKAKRRAYHLDMSLFSLFGLRFGWSSVIGFIPWIGDVIDLYFAIQLVYLCQTITGGLPPNISSKMWFNVAVDFALGLVPILGDLADASWRCNTKNVSVLERYLKEKHGPRDPKQREMDGLEPFPEDVGMIDGVDKLGEQGGHAQYGTTGTAAPGQNMGAPTVQEQNQNKGSRGWFGFSGNGGRQQDLERGQETGVVNVRT